MLKNGEHVAVTSFGGQIPDDDVIFQRSKVS